MNLEVGADSWIRPQIGRSQHWNEPAAASAPGPSIASTNPALTHDSAREQTQGQAPARLRNAGTELEREDYWAEAEKSGEHESFEFEDFLDFVNPLHHIPVVGTLYREFTGDTIRPQARVMGGMLYGGPVGLVAAGVNAVMESASGDDAGGTAFAWAFGEEKPTAETAAADKSLSNHSVAALPASGMTAVHPTPFLPDTESNPGESASYPSVVSANARYTDRSDRIVTRERGDPRGSGKPASDNVGYGPSNAPNGEVLTGAAALNAFLSDIQGVAGAAQQGANEAAAEETLLRTGTAANAPTPRQAERTAAQISPRFLDKHGKPISHSTAPARAFAVPRVAAEPAGPSGNARRADSWESSAQAADQGQSHRTENRGGESFESRMFDAIEKYETLSKSRLSGKAASFTVE